MPAPPIRMMDVLFREHRHHRSWPRRRLETADVRFKDVVPIDGMEDYVEAAQAL